MGRSVSCRPPLASSRGAALVELSISIFLLVLLLVGAADFARVYHHTIDLENAARAGAQYGAQSIGNSVDIDGMKAAATQAAPDTALTPSATYECWCATDDAATYTYYDAAGCDALEECPTNQHLIVRVTVTTSYDFQTIASFGGIFDLPMITRSATMRAQ